MGAHLAAFMLMWSPELVHTQGQVGTGGQAVRSPSWVKATHFSGSTTTKQRLEKRQQQRWEEARPPERDCGSGRSKSPEDSEGTECLLGPCSSLHPSHPASQRPESGFRTAGVGGRAAEGWGGMG